MPIGVETNVDRPTIMRLPTMALRTPPGLPGAGVSIVNSVCDSAPKPLISSVARIHSRKPRPIAIAMTDSAIPTRWPSRRRR